MKQFFVFLIVTFFRIAIYFSELQPKFCVENKTMIFQASLKIFLLKTFFKKMKKLLERLFCEQASERHWCSNWKMFLIQKCFLALAKPAFHKPTTQNVRSCHNAETNLQWRMQCLNNSIVVIHHSICISRKKFDKL